ncbi:hypothetical protein [uncultured Vagococcus sp.]|uniref:hypothetical protein n=1 Tax=uncultured Vagococcus sp. TaxID=189676 RepID=UPI0028D78D67|nr:hypothetical protein [uncultured Vagococcus sp.]
MNKLDDSYFYTFKLNILSGRQTPVAIGHLLRVIIVGQGILGSMALFLAPLVIMNSKAILFLKLVFFGNIVLLAIFSYRTIYKKYPKSQYMLFNINIMFFSFYTILLGCETFFSGTDSIRSFDEFRLPIFFFANIVGIISLIVSFFFFRNNAINGKYQEDSVASEKMVKNELVGKILTPILILSSISVPFIIKNLIPSNGLMFGFMGSLFIFLGCMCYVGTSWTFMTFYCKLRFKSFNPDISELIKDEEAKNDENK